MTDAPTRRKIRPEAVWAKARKAWEDGETARSVARALSAAMVGKRPENVPLWHLPFVLHWRAEHLGVEVAAEDRERNREQDWAGAVWDVEGRMGSVQAMTLAIVRLNRAVWREQVGLPEGAAEGWP